MMSSESRPAGVNRAYDDSRIQKWIFNLAHLFIVLSCAWLLFWDGWTTIGTLFGKQWMLVDPTRAIILFFCALLYWLRHSITLFYLLVRKVDWSEVICLLIFFALFEIGFVLIGGGAFRVGVINLGWLDIVALFLLITGSYLNSFSEIQRKWWKRDPANKGHCYTKGLFCYSMHINYFGDTVMFTGWSLFTYNIWSLGLPLFMASMFIFYHIPGLDLHLAKRYGAEFQTYSKRTKRFIPFVY